MGSGVLVGDHGESTVLSEEEFELLQNALALQRSADPEADAIAKGLLGCSKEHHSKWGGGWFSLFLSELMEYASEVHGEIVGMLVETRRDPIFLRDYQAGEDHMRSLQAFLKILQRRDWLAEFLFTPRIEKYVDKCPTPVELIEALVEPTENFDTDIHNAKRMMREWPELFGIKPFTWPESESAKGASASGD